MINENRMKTMGDLTEVLYDNGKEIIYYNSANLARLLLPSNAELDFICELHIERWSDDEMKAFWRKYVGAEPMPKRDARGCSIIWNRLVAVAGCGTNKPEGTRTVHGKTTLRLYFGNEPKEMPEIKLPKQALTVWEILKEATQDGQGLTRAEVEALMDTDESRQRMKTKQSGVRIFNYYQRPLLDLGLISYVE